MDRATSENFEALKHHSIVHVDLVGDSVAVSDRVAHRAHCSTLILREPVDACARRPSR